jgi:hypothetical protein
LARISSCWSTSMGSRSAGRCHWNRP